MRLFEERFQQVMMSNHFNFSDAAEFLNQTFPLVFVSLYLVETFCSWPHEADICCQIRGAQSLCRLPTSKDRKQVAEVSCQTEYRILRFLIGAAYINTSDEDTGSV